MASAAQIRALVPFLNLLQTWTPASLFMGRLAAEVMLDNSKWHSHIPVGFVALARKMPTVHFN